MLIVSGCYVVIHMISKNEHVMVSLCNRNGVEVGLITANQTETMFYLYEPIAKDYRKIGKSDNPLELERKYNMYEKMGAKS